MTICGLNVYHKKFGQGTISCCEDKMLTAVFPNLDVSEQTKKFIFPDVFLNKQLESSDPRVEEYIQNYIEEQTCSVCGRKNVATKEIDGKRLCQSCEGKHAKKCPECGQVHLNENFSSVHLSVSPYYALMCKDCYSRYVHRCTHCNMSFISHAPVHSHEGKTYCDLCYQNLIRTCEICGAEYWREEGNTICTDDEYIHACPECIQQKTVVCSACDQHVLKEDIVDSKYIPAEKKTCKRCVERCHSCGEPVDDEHSCFYFWKTYCKECESTKKAECPVCGEEYIPDDVSQHLCPDCMDSVAFMEKLQEIDFSSQSAKVMSVYSLDNLDRCKLFTNLYENCRELHTGKEAQNKEEPYHYIVMSLLGYKAVLTYLPWDMTSRVQPSANVTMTELRSNKGRFSVYNAIKEWLPSSDHTLSIPEGEVQLLHYPVLIRAQTEYDKVYGKEWNGPDDYIEIGNYGDTTKFYIIGVLK